MDSPMESEEDSLSSLLAIQKKKITPMKSKDNNQKHDSSGGSDDVDD